VLWHCLTVVASLLRHYNRGTSIIAERTNLVDEERGAQSAASQSLARWMARKRSQIALLIFADVIRERAWSLDGFWSAGSLLPFFLLPRRNR